MAMVSNIWWSDVSLVGIGLDIAGAVLLANGLLMNDRQVIGVTRTYLNFSPHQVIWRTDDRITGTIGVGSILCGVVAQLVGYAASLSFGLDTAGSPARGLFAVILAAAAIGIVWLVYLAIRPIWKRRLLIRIAHYDNDLNRQPNPYGGILVALGRAAEMSPPADGESETQYARRVWRVREVIEGWPPGS